MNLPFYDEMESWRRTLSERDICLHTHTHTHTFFKKSTVTLVQIKLEDRGFSHLVTLPVGPLWVAGGHREDPLPSPEWVLKWYMW